MLVACSNHIKKCCDNDNNDGDDDKNENEMNNESAIAPSFCNTKYDIKINY